MKKLSIAIIAAMFFLAFAALLMLAPAAYAYTCPVSTVSYGCCCDIEGNATKPSVIGFLPDFTPAECTAPFTSFIEVSDAEYCKMLYEFAPQCDSEQWCGSVTQVITPPPVTGCEPDAPKEGPKSLIVTVPQQGERKLKLEWDQKCTPTSYNIYRCAGASCKTINIGPENKFFFDISEETQWLPYDSQTSPIQWNADYDYTVGAVFGGTEMNSTPLKFRKNLGDIECWDKTPPNEPFCISEYFYTTNSKIATYLKTFGYTSGSEGTADEFKSDLSGTVGRVFASNIDRRGTCDANNEFIKDDLICAGKTACTPDGCVSTECDVPEGVLGLRVTNTSCEFNSTTNKKKYCFFDRSPYLFDKCYECASQMGCYDYKSKYACEKDNCDVVKAGSCSWQPLYDSGLGIGVCIDTKLPQCKWCDKNGTEGAKNADAWNSIFDVCTRDRSNALAANGYTCLFYTDDNGIDHSTDCLTSTCRSYNSGLQTDCGITPVVLGADNSKMSRSGADDPCGLKVCKWFGDANKCRKDADADTEMDCLTDVEACESDLFPPKTEIIGVYNELTATTDYLKISISDQHNIDENGVVHYREGINQPDTGLQPVSAQISGFKTYLCIVNATNPCDNAKDFKTKGFVVNTTVLSISDGQISLSPFAKRWIVTDKTLAPGQNTIKFYSRDPDNNLGLVKSVNVTACLNCAPPRIENLYVEGANYYPTERIYYTKLQKPNIIANLTKNVTIEYYLLRNSTQYLVSGVQNTTLVANTSFKFNPTSDLAEGNYTFNFSAKAANNVYLIPADPQLPLKLVVDKTSPALAITPANGARVSLPSQILKLEFNEKTILKSAALDYTTLVGSVNPTIQHFVENITLNFTTADNKTFTFTYTSLAEGTNVLSISAEDYAGNPVSGTSTFLVDTDRPPSITIRTPPYGISPTKVFDIVIETTKEAVCKYSTEQFMDMNNIDYNYSMSFFKNAAGLDITAPTMQHTLYDFAELAKNELDYYTKLRFFVKCTSQAGPSQEFNLWVDNSNPVVTAIADPAEIVERTPPDNKLITTLRVNTSREAFCKYNDSGWKEFDNFDGSPRNNYIAKVAVGDGLSQKTYPIYCIPPVDYNLPWGQQRKTYASPLVTVTVTLGKTLEINCTQCPKYWGDYTKSIMFLTNKKAQCTYTYGTQEAAPYTADTTTHTPTLNVAQPPGSKTITIRCLAGETKSYIYNFTVDTSAPNMTFVDDSSELLANPEITIHKDKIRVAWNATDLETGIAKYLFKLIQNNSGTPYSDVTIINCRAANTNCPVSASSVDFKGIPFYISQNESGGALNLTDGNYYFNVSPQNPAELIGNSKNSDGVRVYYVVPDHCYNKDKDAGETDIDCGGECPGCEEGENCGLPSDCASNNCIVGKCKADSFAPNTTITVAYDPANGTSKYLFVSIKDKTSISQQTESDIVPAPANLADSTAKSFPEGYATYICISASCAPTAQVTKTPITITQGGNLSVNNTPLKDANGNVLKVADGNNVFRFYSTDPDSNLEIVKEMNIIACTNCLGPGLVGVAVDGARKVNNVYYTASPDLTTTASFDVSATLTSKSLTKQGAQISLAQTPASGFSQTFALTPSQAAEAAYLLNFSAKGTNNVVASGINPAGYQIVIDRTPPTITFSLQQNAAVPNKEVIIEINFSQPAFENSTTAMLAEPAYVNGFAYVYLRNLTSSLRKVDADTYKLDIPNLNDGTQSLNISGEDYAGNLANATLNFKVDATGPAIVLDAPAYGIATSAPFNITISTPDAPSRCRQSIFGAMPYDNMASFEETTNVITHHVSSATFEGITWPECAPRTLYVTCRDQNNRETATSFELMVSGKTANITAAFADPATVVERDVNENLISSLTVVTSCNSFCKYSEDYAKKDSYDLMENEFAGFGLVPSKVNTEPIMLPSAANKPYYIGCKAPTGGIPDYANITVLVELTGNVTLSCTNCPIYWNSTTNTITVSTNKRSQCDYTIGTIKKLFDATGENSHLAAMSVASATPAKKTAQITCIAGNKQASLQYNFTVDITSPMMLYVNDNSSLPGNESEYSYSKDILKVSWLGQDNETGVSRYFYTLKETGATSAIVDCSPEKFNSSCSFATKSKDQFNFDNNGKALNLTEGKKYYFTVWPQNPLGMTGSSMESNGVTINSTKTPAMCSNGAKDPGNETDVDCGGVCPQCADNMTCNIDNDCKSGNCILAGILKVCKPASCADMKWNGNETGADCGGNCAALGKRCDSGQGCAINDDCKTGLLCTNSQCQAPTQCTNQQIDAGESDVDCGGSCPTKCASGKSCTSATDCITGLYCNSGHCATTTDAGDSDGDTIPNDQDKCPGTPKGERVDKNGCSVSQRDTDNDGMLDSWELKYGFDPEDPSNAGVDSDGDGLTNLQEYNYFKQTGREIDPTKKDTDGDGWTDDEELKAGTDPTNPSSHPTSAGVKKVGKILLWILILILIGVAGWIGYKKLLPAFKKDGLPKPGAPGFPAWPRGPLIRMHSGVPAHPVQKAEEREKLEAREAREAAKPEGKEYIPLEDLVERLKRERPTAALIEQLRRARLRQPAEFEKMKAEPGVWQKLKSIEAAKPGEEEFRELKRLKRR